MNNFSRKFVFKVIVIRNYSKPIKVIWFVLMDSGIGVYTTVKNKS